MSVETLILLAFFVLVPLLQRLLAEARERKQPTPQPAQRAPSPALEADRFEMPPPAPAREAVTQAVALSSRPRRGRRRGASAMLRTRLDLRRAIVAAAILGPCRAVDPHY